MNYDIKDYPAIEDWFINGDWVLEEKLPIGAGKLRLEQTGEKQEFMGVKFTSRKKTNNKWFETQDSISYWDDFEKQKIVYPNMTKYLPFYLDTEGYMTNQKCFILVGEKLAYLTAVFSSKLFKYCFSKEFPQLGEDRRELSKFIFESLPILKISESNDNIFYESILQIQSEYSDAKATEIDEMIFDLYHLTSEERQVIRESVE